MKASGGILIIGGGIVGGSIAWELARAGASVILCDAGVLGGEASWAGAGMLVPGSEYAELTEACRFATESLQLWPDYAAQLAECSGCAVDFRVCGSLELAGDEQHWRVLQSRAALQRSWGMRNEPVDASDLRGIIPALRSGLHGAVFYPEEGQADPRTVMAALRSAYQQLPVTLREHTTVTHLEPNAAGLRATLCNGDRIEASAAVLAAGAWSCGLSVPGHDLPPVSPVKGHLVGYQLGARTIPHVLRFHHTYVLQRNSGYTIAGTSEEHAGFDRTVDPAHASDIAARASALVPGLLQREPEDVWTGFRPGTPGEMPYLHRVPGTCLWLAYGHFRNGILLAPATAKRIAAEILAATCRTGL